MILKNKKLLIITSLLTLLPIPIGLLLQTKFPETMAIHFGLTGQADGYASSSFAILCMPFAAFRPRIRVSASVMRSSLIMPVL